MLANHTPRPEMPSGAKVDWARRDPDLALIHDEPEFQQLYPATSGA